MDLPDCVKRCSTCHFCNTRCGDFIEEVCLRLSQPPYVCNGCGGEAKCVLRKRFYRHSPAHGNYRGIRGGLLRAKNGDMPRICGRKPRARKPVEHKVDTKCRVGRTHAEYRQLVAAEPDIRNDSQSVIDAFARLWDLAGPDLFRRLFPLILTDNGSEFSNPRAIELDPEGNPRTRVFYGDARATNQKARIERNHELVRTVLPKGTSFDELAQADIDRMLSHVNSYSRPSLNDKAPFDLFAFLYGGDILARLGQRRIPPNQIVLRPELLDAEHPPERPFRNY